MSTHCPLETVVGYRPTRRTREDGDVTDLLSVDEAAARLHISVYTLRYLRQEGRFAPAIRVGRRLFWTETDLEAWLAAQKEPA